MTVHCYRFHKFQGSFVGFGTPDDVRRYVDKLNEGRASNLWSAQPLTGLAPHHGADVAAELAKLDNRKN